jgi:DNA-3-methyladenine glycosylase
LKPLPRTFYQPSARQVAPELLGHLLVRNTARGKVAAAIVETEAYLLDDPACHGAPGPTPRNRIMFGPAGFAYVYFIYGCHFCVNAVCQPTGRAEAVLIRAVHPVMGEALMRASRPTTHRHQLTNGPGKLCQALSIDRKLNGADLCAAESDLFIAANPSVAEFRQQFGPVQTGPRIGINKAKELALRFWLNCDPFISRGAPKVTKTGGRS